MFKALSTPRNDTPIHAVHTLIGNEEHVSYYATRQEAITALRREARWTDAKKQSETHYTGEDSECWLQATQIGVLGYTDEELFDYPTVADVLKHANIRMTH